MEVLHCSSLRWSTKASMATLVLSPMRSPHRESNPLVPRYATERTLRFAYLEQAVGNVAGNAFPKNTIAETKEVADPPPRFLNDLPGTASTVEP